MSTAFATPADKRYELRRLVEVLAEHGLPLADVPSPATLAAEHDRLFVTRDHIRVIDEALVWLADTPGGRLMVNIPPQLGKLVSHDTPVPTPSGWTNHGDLRPGDEVYHPSGKVVRVVAVSADDVASLRVHTSDGGHVDVHPNHEWTVHDRSRFRAPLVTATTQELREQGLVQGTAGKRGSRCVFQLPQRGPIEGDATADHLPIDPYTLGVWLGDGSSSKAAITHHPDDEYALPYPASARCVHADTGIVTTYYRGGLHTALKALGVHRNKHIPASYLRASEGARRALLAGLIDSDGTIAHTGQVSFSNTNVRLIEGFIELVRTLGYRATVHKPLQPRVSTSGVAGTMPVHMVSFTPHDGHVPARLARKACNLTGGTPTESHPARKVGTARYRRIAITSIEEIAPKPGRCVQVDAPDGLYVVGEHFTPTHNSTLVSRWLPFWWLLQRPMDRIVLTSYASSLAAGHSAACRDLIADFGAEYGLSLSPTESNRTDWTLTTGGGLRARGVRGGLTGNPMDLGIIDDPLADRAQADSPVYRDAVWEWYSSVFLSRMSPGARQVVIMTRWHQDDLSGRLLKRDGRLEDGGLWRVVHLPAIAVKADRERGFYDDPMGRAAGEPLPHPKIPAGDRAAAMAFWTRRRADSTSRDWNALYQGVPHDTEGSLLSDLDVLRATVHQVPALRRIAVGVDPSGGGRDEAGLVAGGLGADGRVYLTRNLTARMTSDRWATAACTLAAEVGADRIVVEKNFGGDMARLLILQAWENLVRDGKAAGLPPMIHEVTARRSKVLRAEPIAQAIKGREGSEEGGRVRFGDAHELKTLKAEWTMWTPGSTWSPGALDASVHLVTELLPALPGGARIASPTGRRRGDVGRGGGPRIERRA